MYMPSPCNNFPDFENTGQINIEYQDKRTIMSAAYFILTMRIYIYIYVYLVLVSWGMNVTLKIFLICREISSPS